MKKTITIDTPALYGDHHVLEVRQLLHEFSGVENVYASSAFHVVEVTFDPDKVKEADIVSKLSERGYLEELSTPQEEGIAPYSKGESAPAFFRHTEVFEQNRRVLSFAQEVSYSGRPLWNCPGMGVINDKMED
jgi:copper chaperone CopZ